MPEAAYGRCNRWLTVILITPEKFGANREEERLALEGENIEARPRCGLRLAYASERSRCICSQSSTAEVSLRPIGAFRDVVSMRRSPTPRWEATPVEFPWGNPIQLGKEIRSREKQRSGVRSQRSDDGKADVGGGVTPQLNTLKVPPVKFAFG